MAIKIKTDMVDRQGFTLLELVAVMLILGLLASLAIPRYMSMDASASLSAIDAAVSELNGRESLIWADLKISESGYDEGTSDTQIWNRMKNNRTNSYPDLGRDYRWTAGPDQTGGTLQFKSGDPSTLVRSSSSLSDPANWSR